MLCVVQTSGTVDFLYLVGWTTFPNQRTQYPAQVRVEVYNQCPQLSER